ncbi:MAG TPA: response regulator [Edaphobacter sp.]
MPRIFLLVFLLAHGNYCTAIAGWSGTGAYQLILFANMSNGAVRVRVLVVDDDAVSREVLALLLARQGYSVEAVESGDAALLRLREAQGSLPEVVLTDLQMPGLAGIELVRQIRAVCGPQTILLAMSGSEPAQDVRQVFDGFIQKPFSMEIFAAVIAGRTVAPAGEAILEDVTVLDQTIYEKLAASMRPERLGQLYALCLDDARRRIGAMRLAVSGGDDNAYRKEAHAIKGGCGMVGATELQRLAASMEMRGLDATNHVATLDEFLLGCERLERMLVAHEIEHKK